MELASEIGLRLNVGGIWPEGAAHALTRNGTRAPVEHEKGNELLLSRARQAGDRSAIDPDIETAEQIDPERGCACHISKITRECPLVRMLNRRRHACVRMAEVSLFVTSWARPKPGFHGRGDSI